MADAHPAVFFVSTGRCGTQWLQKALGGTYSDLAVVTHEPVRGPYEPKRYLRAYDRLDELLAAGAVARHLAFIQGTIGTKTYIETGWPSYPALPLRAPWPSPQSSVTTCCPARRSERHSSQS